MPSPLPDPATPLSEVTFCVLDLETTGGSPAADAITELGAVLVRGGEVLGTFQTFVHPGHAIPARITYLTGITDAMVATAPRPESILPTFREFLRTAVVVGHNVRFDLSFLNAALERRGDERLDNPYVDTCALARRLVRDEVPDCRLGTLAAWLRLDHVPTHRALTDALATTDLLHHLLERVPAYGVFTLDDLLALPRLAGHPHAAKLRLTDHLPRTPGVYEFVDREGQVVYVGKATNLRQRVRSYFGNDDRRTIRPLLAALHAVRHRPAPDPLVAEVMELRLLHRARPRFNRAGALPRRPAWLALTAEPFPRFTITATPLAQATALGPFASTALARRAQEAIESAVPIRRCTVRLGPRTPRRAEPCTPQQLGVALCPCAGQLPLGAYPEAVTAAERILRQDPAAALGALAVRLAGLAAARRFEEAADVRDRGRALATAHRDRAIVAALRGAGSRRLRIGSTEVVVEHGRLVSAVADGVAYELPAPVDGADAGSEVLTPAALAEAKVIARWLLRAPGRWHSDDPTADAELLDALRRASTDPWTAPLAELARAGTGELPAAEFRPAA